MRRTISNLEMLVGCGACAAAVVGCGGEDPAAPTPQPPAPPPTVAMIDLCHTAGDGTFTRITIPADSAAAHEAHGDAEPGEPVPVTIVAYLVGGQIYHADPTTGAVDTVEAHRYQYSTNGAAQDNNHSHFPVRRVSMKLDSNCATVPADIQGGFEETAIAIGLANGENVFEYEMGVSFPRSGYGFNLFFGADGVSYNPDRCTVDSAGHLNVAVPAGSSEFFIPAAGTSVLRYDSSTLDLGCSTTAASGAPDYVVGSHMVSVSALAEDGDGTTAGPLGSLTLVVRPTS